MRACRSFLFRKRVYAFIAVVTIGGLAAALARSHASPARAASSPPAIDPAVASQLSVFDRPATAADTLPSGFGAQLKQQYADASPDLADSRAVTANDGQTAYLVPTGEGVCVINANEEFCTPAVALPGAAVADLCSPTLAPGQLELEWVLPDGATNVALGMSDGARTGFAPGHNVYIARLPLAASSPMPETIQWDDAKGQHHSVATPIPRGAARQSCTHPSAPISPPLPPDPSALTQTVTGPATPIEP
jgi:hypothetical protein